MNIREINKPVTAASLNESLAKRFGKRIALETFTLEQLQDARNKLRTKISQVETNESFDTVSTSETYQKNKLFLDVLNAEISERSDVAEADLAKGKARAKKLAAAVSEGAKPDFLDVDKDGDKKEPMKKAAKDKEGNDSKGGKKYSKKEAEAYFKKQYGSKFNAKKMGTETDDKGVKYWMDKGHSGEAVEMKESIVREGAEDQAELVMAAKDMVDRLTGWMEDTAEMQTESMLELADAIRDEMGQEQSDSFVGAVKPALEQLYAAMETTRTALTGGVGQLTGEAQPADTMGAEEELPADLEGGDEEMEPTVDMEGDEFAAAGAAAGGEEEAGRAKRESIQRKREMLESSRRLGTILSKKK